MIRRRESGPALWLMIFIVSLGGCGGASRAVTATGPTDPSMWYSDSYQISCESVGVEGVQVLQVSTIARNEGIALMEARRAAVKGILFRGVQSSVCQVPALVPRPRMTPEAHQEFLKLFADGGPYLSFIVGAGDDILDIVSLPGRTMRVTSVVSVDRRALNGYLESMGIVTGLGDVFRRD